MITINETEQNLNIHLKFKKNMLELFGPLAHFVWGGKWSIARQYYCNNHKKSFGPYNNSRLIVGRKCMSQTISSRLNISSFEIVILNSIQMVTIASMWTLGHVG